MERNTLLSTEKSGPEEAEPTQFAQYPINEFEKDYHKIVSSAAFRRLQDKTQVFPLDKSDFVRTRLTHSIEVSTVARQLGIMISKNNTPYKPADIDGDAAEGIEVVHNIDQLKAKAEKKRAAKVHRRELKVRRAQRAALLSQTEEQISIFGGDSE